MHEQFVYACDQRPKTKDQKEQIEGPSGHVLSCACTTLLSLPNLLAGVYGRVYRALQRMENEDPTIADRL